jgi:cytochrome c551/c552
MIGRVVVMEPRDYQAWLSGSDGQPLAARGQQLFQQLACMTCHLNDGTGRGPSLAGVYGSKVELANGTGVMADDGYIRESILTPQMKLVSGIPARDADVPGARERRGRDEPDRVHQVAARAGCPAQTATAPAARPAQR